MRLWLGAFMSSAPCSSSSRPVAPSGPLNNTVDGPIGFSHRSPRAPRVTASRKRGERVTRKPRVVTFRLDQATWDRMRELVPYTKYRNPSSFIREGIELLLKQEEAQ